MICLVLEDTRTHAVAVAGDKLENGVVRGAEESTPTEHSPQSTVHRGVYRAEVRAQCAGRADAIVPRITARVRLEREALLQRVPVWFSLHGSHEIISVCLARALCAQKKHIPVPPASRSRRPRRLDMLEAAYPRPTVRP